MQVPLKRLKRAEQVRQEVALSHDEQWAEQAWQVPLLEKVPEGQVLMQVELERLKAGLQDWHSEDEVQVEHFESHSV